MARVDERRCWWWWCWWWCRAAKHQHCVRHRTGLGLDREEFVKKNKTRHTHSRRRRRRLPRQTYWNLTLSTNMSSVRTTDDTPQQLVFAVIRNSCSGTNRKRERERYQLGLIVWFRVLAVAIDYGVLNCFGEWCSILEYMITANFKDLSNVFILEYFGAVIESNESQQAAPL